MVAELNRLKEPQEALPKQLWTGLQEEIGVFPDPGRVAELIQAFSGAPETRSFLSRSCFRLSVVALLFRARMSVLYRDISRMQYIASFGNIAI